MDLYTPTVILTVYWEESSEVHQNQFSETLQIFEERFWNAFEWFWLAEKLFWLAKCGKIYTSYLYGNRKQ